MIGLAIGAALGIALHLRVRRWLRLRSAHVQLGRLALPAPGPTPYQLAVNGYLDALDRCAEDRARRRALRAPPPPRSLPSDGVPEAQPPSTDGVKIRWDSRPPPTSMPGRGVPRLG